jgi:PLP dependent protein
MGSQISKNIERIRNAMAEAALRSGRNVSDIKLMAVTKTVDDDRLMEAIEAGIDIIGESYIQEAKRKIEKIGRPLEWHMIGHLQSNKVRYVIKLFDMIHSVDQMDLAVELDRRGKNAGQTMKILIEVNVSGEKTKSGVPLAEAVALVRSVAALENLAICGLMTMPPWFDDPEEARPCFTALRDLKNRVMEEEIPGVNMGELSMGMSGDYEVAIEEGATIVRIGTNLFGARPVKSFA